MTTVAIFVAIFLVGWAVTVGPLVLWLCVIAAALLVWGLVLAVKGNHD